MAHQTSHVSEKLISECRQKLIQAKTDILNRVKEARMNLDNDDKGGDEADQTVRVLAEAEFLSMHERLRNQLFEIESALGRIESGSFGGCGKTEELMDYIGAVEKALGMEAKKNFMDMQPGDTVRSSADISKAKKMLGFDPKTQIKDGVPKFVEWYRSYYGV
jgi:DnaK suppressor protein